jgi:hypothetical protein
MLILQIGMVTAVFAQQGLLQTLSAQSNNYRSGILQEKVFVHLDKPFYMAGEILWCKVYCVEGSSHRPLSVSKLVYAELLDRDNRPILQGKILLDSGQGNGSFYLATSINSGIYRLRAYTNWMKNTGAGTFFEEPVTIVNPFKNLPASMQASFPDSPAAAGRPTAQPKASNPKWMPSGRMTGQMATGGTIGLFPEGGNLVNGLQSRIGFEMTDRMGRGVDGKGFLLDKYPDQHDDTLIGFRPLHAGIGSFSFTPVAGHRYAAVALFPDGTAVSRDLPAAFERGYVMQVSAMDKGGTDHLLVKVTGKGISPGSDVYLVVRAGRMKDFCRKAAFTFSKGHGTDSALFVIDKSLLGKGVNQLTLLDSAGQPVCERLYAIPPGKELAITATTDNITYGLRQQVRVSLNTQTPEGQATAASLSMAVYREDSLQPRDETDIFSYLWLSSDLKGRIESPDYYLSEGETVMKHEGTDVEGALDNLMLTHGWRRFHWEDMQRQLANPHPVPPEHGGQLITGRILNGRTGTPAAGILVFCSAPGLKYQFASARTDATGQFFFDIKDYFGSGGILIQTNTPKDIEYKIEVNSPFYEQFDGDSLPPFHLTDAWRNVLQDHSLSMQVQNIYLADSGRKFRSPLIDSFRFFGRPDYTYKLDDYTRFTTMEEVLREYVREINVNHLNGHLHPVLENEPLKQFFDDNNALILLDGIPIADEKLFAYDPLKVNKLDVIPRTFLLGPTSFSGIASFTTYKGDYEGVSLDSRSLLVEYDGLQVQREFYAPSYGTTEQMSSRIPDFRNVLYWAPDTHSNGQGKMDCSFYTSDLPGKYLIVVQGLTEDGRAGICYHHFEVK